MYAIAEKNTQTGQQFSRDNCRMWLGLQGKQTPCEDEAETFDTAQQAKDAAAEAGIVLDDAGGWWTVATVPHPEDKYDAAR